MKVADMHCDTILAILRGKEQGKEISLRKNNLNVDLERMKKGNPIRDTAYWQAFIPRRARLLYARIPESKA